MKRTILCMLIISTLLLAACANPRGHHNHDHSVDMSLELVGGKSVGPAQFEITIKDKEGAEVNDAAVQVVGDMSHAGMKKVYADASSVGKGMYVSDGFEFTMGGDWIITVAATLADGSIAEEVFTINSITGEAGHDEHEGHGDHMHESEEKMDDHSSHEMDHDSMNHDADHAEHSHEGHDTKDHDHSMHHEMLDLGDGDFVPSLALSTRQDESGKLYLLIDTDLNMNEGDSHVDGEGHAHVSINGAEHVKTTDELFPLEMQEGEHEVTVELATNNHKLYAYKGQVVSETIVIVVGEDGEVMPTFSG